MRKTILSTDHSDCWSSSSVHTISPRSAKKATGQSELLPTGQSELLPKGQSELLPKGQSELLPKGGKCEHNAGVSITLWHKSAKQ